MPRKRAITPEQRDEMKALAKQGYTARQLATIFEVNLAIVYRYANITPKDDEEAF